MRRLLAFVDAAADRRIWQRDYYEHIIRDDASLDRIQRYIAANPARWAEGRDDTDALVARMRSNV